jgi:hypothetical protein
MSNPITDANSIGAVSDVNTFESGGLTGSSALTGVEIIPISQSADLVQTTVQGLANYVMNGLAPLRQSIPVLANGQASYVSQGYSPVLIDVFVSGIRLNPSQYQATDGVHIVITDSNVLSVLTTGMTVDIAAAVAINIAGVATPASVSALIPTNQPAVNPLTGAELVSVSQGAGLYQSTISKIAAWMLGTVYIGSYSQLRSYTGTASTIQITGYQTTATPVGIAGVFVQDTSGNAAVDDGGTVIVGNDGRVWRREYDGVNVQAAWYGITPATTDIGPYFALFPQYRYIWFQPGAYTVQTYPTETQFNNKFYRGVSTIWRCAGSLAGSLSTGDLLPAFTWSFQPSQAFGTDSDGGNINDMMLAGLSPIEGIGIIGNSLTQGIGFAIGNSGTNVYFMRPKNFSVQNFGVGFQYLRSMANCFLTGLENVVLKSNGTNIICDNTDIQNPNEPGAFNSGENFYFKSCYIGGATVVGVNIVRNQLCTFDNCSFDYNLKMAIFNNSNVKMKNCYVEGNPANMQNWFDVLGVSCLDVDTGTNIYMLGGTTTQMNSWDVFNVNSNGYGNPNVRCSASIFSAPQRYKPLSSSGVMNVFGSMMRCNGSKFPTIVSESANLFPDARLSAPTLALYPNSTSGVTLGTIGGTPQPNTGSTSAIRILAQSANQSFVWPKMGVVPGKELYLQWYEYTDVALSTKTLTVLFYTADGVLIPATTFISGQFTTTVPAPTSFNTWIPQMYAVQAPMGAAYAVVTMTLANGGNTSGSWFIGTIYAFV